MWFQKQPRNKVRGEIEEEKDEIPCWGKFSTQHFDSVKLVSFSLTVQNQKSNHW